MRNEIESVTIMAGNCVRGLNGRLAPNAYSGLKRGIDAVGWLFVAFAIAITAIAAVIAYQGNVREFGSTKSTTEGRGTQ
jgi:hypothetical protein